jgi:hypothetical protein
LSVDAFQFFQIFLQKKKYYRINTYKAVKDEKQALNKIEELLFKSADINELSIPPLKSEATSTTKPVYM